MRGVPERGRRFYLVKWRGFDGDPMEESTWETAEDLAETAAGAVDDFWAAHRELDRCRPREVPGEHRCPWCCEPKPKVRRQSPAEKAAGLLPAGPVLYGKGSIFDTAAGLKRHQARCAGKPRSRAGTRSEKAMARKTRESAAATIPPVKMEGDGVEEDDIDFVSTFKYLGFHFESAGLIHMSSRQHKKSCIHGGRNNHHTLPHMTEPNILTHSACHAKNTSLKD
eukprot:SAG11_NODE_5846_length_1449_cov_4.767407_1_plen_224_part_00